ncbi:putative LRR receptor-like serine/threonine-protein kinase At4g37250 [Wolffia australiana]
MAVRRGDFPCRMGLSSGLYSAAVLLLLLAAPPQTAALTSDGHLLLSFKHGITDDPLNVLSSWNFKDETPCNWNGISCSIFSSQNNTLRVVSLVLANSRLAGTINGDLSLIEHLRRLDLSGNFISGELPAVGFPAAERVDLSCNLLSGSIPSTFLLSVSLRSLNLSRNRISGKIPDEFAGKISSEAAIDLSFNNLSGEIPCSKSLLAQRAAAFKGDTGLCGAPLKDPCADSPPAFAAMPKPTPTRAERSLKPATIAAIVAADVAGVSLLLLASIYAYKIKNKKKRSSCSGSSGSGSETDTDFSEPRKRSTAASVVEKKAVLVTVAGDELELETLLKASAYILGSRGSSILYKAVLSDGAALAVRRIGEDGGAAGKLKDFEAQVKGIAKLRHPNLLGIRGFYWGADEKLLIYDYHPNGSLANVAYRKTGASPFHLSWENRLRIARGVARALAFLHENKYVHGNLKPSNVLLRYDFEPLVADFAVDRLLAGGGSLATGPRFGSMRSNFSQNSQPETAAPATSAASPCAAECSGLSPYQAPEALKNLKPNAKWDAYSFGVVLLELLAGRVISAVNSGADGGDVLRIVDPAIRGDVAGGEETFLSCFELAFSCTAAAPQKRPSLKEAAQLLDRYLPLSLSTA